MRRRSVGIFSSHVGAGVVLELEFPPLADDHAQGSGEAFFAEAALVSHSPDDLVVGLFEVDHTGDIFTTHFFPPGMDLCGK